MAKEPIGNMRWAQEPAAADLKPDAAENTEKCAEVSGTARPEEGPACAEKDAEHAPRLTPAIQGHLGRQLRAHYSELVQEPVPDRLTKLLNELARQQVK